MKRRSSCSPRGSAGEGGERYLAKEAEILLSLDRNEEALERLELLAAGGGERNTLLAVEVYQRLERYADSIPLLERVIETNPDSTQARFWLGASLERTGRDGEAVSMFEALLEIDPQFAPALNYLGYMWAEQGTHLDQALEMVTLAVALEPDNGAYVDSLGWAHFRLGQLEQARDHLERAAALVGEDAVVFEHLGDLYVAMGWPDKAREVYERALALEGENADAVRRKLADL